MSRNKLIYDEETKKAKHIFQETSVRRHSRHSHQIGDAVEFIGKDKKNRGIGIVLYETNASGLNIANLSSELQTNAKDKDFTHVKVFWQITQTEEVLHKRFLRKIPSTETGRVLKK